MNHNPAGVNAHVRPHLGTNGDVQAREAEEARGTGRPGQNRPIARQVGLPDARDQTEARLPGDYWQACRLAEQGSMTRRVGFMPKLEHSGVGAFSRGVGSE